MNYTIDLLRLIARHALTGLLLALTASGLHAQQSAVESISGSMPGGAEVISLDLSRPMDKLPPSF